MGIATTLQPISTGSTVQKFNSHRRTFARKHTHSLKQRNMMIQDEITAYNLSSCPTGLALRGFKL